MCAFLKNTLCIEAHQLGLGAEAYLMCISFRLKLKGFLWHLGGFPGDSYGKEFSCNARDPSSVPGLGRSLGERNGNPLQYSCLENPMDRGAWWATVHGVAKSWTRLSDITFFLSFTDDLCMARYWRNYFS